MLLVLLLAFSVGAEQLGQIRLVMRYRGNAVSGGTVKLYEVTDYDISNDPEVLARQLRLMDTDGKMAPIGQDGTVSFVGLTTGIYLLVQEDAATGYYAMKPFFISIPITVDDQIQFEIEAYPKLERIPDEKLPQTGQHNLPVILLMGGGILLISLGILVQKRK